jgi:hypothetical protein
MYEPKQDYNPYDNDVKVEADRGEDLGGKPNGVVIVHNVNFSHFEQFSCKCYQFSPFWNWNQKHPQEGLAFITTKRKVYISIATLTFQTCEIGITIRSTISIVLSVASDEDIRQLQKKEKRENEAVSYIQNACDQRGMPLNIIDAEFQYDKAVLVHAYIC